MFNIFSWFENTTETIFSKIVPQSLQNKIGLFAHTFAANLVHDFGDLAHTLTSEIVSEVWTTIEKTASTLAPQVLSGKVSFLDAIKAGVDALKSDAAGIMLPALTNTSEATISSWLGPLITTSLAAASQNPTSAPGNSPGDSSSAQSNASSGKASPTKVSVKK